MACRWQQGEPDPVIRSEWYRLAWNDGMRVALSQNIKYISKSTFNRTKVITTEWEKTPHVHTKIRTFENKSFERVISGHSGSFKISSSLCSPLSRHSPTQPDKLGILPYSYLPRFSGKEVLTYVSVGYLLFVQKTFLKFCPFLSSQIFILLKRLIKYCLILNRLNL